MFNFAAAAIRDISFAADAARELAAGHGCDQKREKRDPIFRVGNGKRTDGRQEKIIEGKNCGDRHQNRHRHSPDGGNC